VKRGAAYAAALCALACHPAAHTPQGRIESCRYELTLALNGDVDVRAACKAQGVVTFRAAEPVLARAISGPDGGLPFRSPTGKLQYRVSLSSISEPPDVDRAARVGQSFVAPLSNVLLVPEPLTSEIPVDVEVTAAPGVASALGLARGEAAGSFKLMAHEIPVATYFSFGKLEQRTLRVGQGELELSQLDGPLDQSFEHLAHWVEVSAGAVADFYRAFPVRRASVTVVPLPGRDGVVFGKVLPESEPGIVLLLGQHAPRQALYTDWILIHELFHLGFPSFVNEGKWLDEGLATYYEPIIRVRAGLYTEHELWDELEAKLPQGLPAFTQNGLERANDFRGIYWGGALACLAADVRARQRRLDSGLEQGLRALREAGGNACEVWSLTDAIAVIDRTLGEPTLAPIAAAHAKRGQSFDLKALLADLGVSRDRAGTLRLSDDAPLSAVRRAIVRGK
jgi:hypothetical protein